MEFQRDYQVADDKASRIQEAILEKKDVQTNGCCWERRTLNSSSLLPQKDLD